MDGNSTLNFIPAVNYEWKLKDYRMQIGFLLEVNYRLFCSWLSSLQQWIKTHGGRVLQNTCLPQVFFIFWPLHLLNWSLNCLDIQLDWPSLCCQLYTCPFVSSGMLTVFVSVMYLYCAEQHRLPRREQIYKSLTMRQGWLRTTAKKREAKQQAQKGITSKMSWNKNKQHINPGSDFHRLLPSPEERDKC